MQQPEPGLRWLNGLGGGAAIRFVRLNQQWTETEGAGLKSACELCSPAWEKGKQFQGPNGGLGAKRKEKLPALEGRARDNGVPGGPWGK